MLNEMKIVSKSEKLCSRYAQLTMVKNHTMKTKCSVKLMERSIYSAKYCFAENLRRNGLMAESEYQVLTSWFDHLVGNPELDLGVDLVIYLRTTPEIARERLLSRGFSSHSFFILDAFLARAGRRALDIIGVSPTPARPS